MAGRGQKTALVMQDGKMTSQGEMVTLEALGDSNEEFLSLLVCGVRFMRSGCSGVQILINSECFTFGNREERRLDTLNMVKEALMNIQDNGREIFVVSSPEVWAQGTAITITHRVAEQTKDMTFDEVLEGQDFLVSLMSTQSADDHLQEVRLVRIAWLGGYFGVILSKEGHGNVVQFRPDKPVKLIL